MSFRFRVAPHGALTAVATAIALQLPAIAFAQTAAPAQGVAPRARAADAPKMDANGQPVFAIRGFTIKGANPLSGDQTTRALAPFLRADATIDTLQKAVAALEATLAAAGHALHKVALPPQEIGETVTLEVVSFTIDKVAIAGNQFNDEANVRRALPALREGATPDFKALAVQTAIANENLNRQLQVGLKESATPDRLDATVTVKDQRPWTLALGASNSGSTTTGRDRVTVSGGHTNLWNADHQFQAAYTTSPQRPGDVRQIGLAYKAPAYALGGVFGASFTRSDVVGDFGAFTSTGAGRTAGASYSHYFAPVGGRRTFLTLSLEDKRFDAAKINDIEVPGNSDRRSRPLTLGFGARWDNDLSVVAANLDLAGNVGGGRNNDLESYRSEDPRIDTTRWVALRGAASYLTPIGNWQILTRGQWQWSGDALIAGEQFGLGGLGSVRGTAIERPVSGDMGVSGTVETTTPEVLAGLRFAAFVDAGWIGNHRGDGFGKPSTDRLAGVGLGLRYLLGPFTFTADYGRIVRGSRVPLSVSAQAPRRGDDRFYLSANLRF